MPFVWVRVTSAETDWFPPLVTVELSLVDGTVTEIVEKAPVLGVDEVQVGSSIPLDCDVMAQNADGSLTILPLHGVESADGRDTFAVAPTSVGITRT